MRSSRKRTYEFTPELVLSAYAQGIFPMSDSRRGEEVRWFRPDPRGVIPLDAFHVPKNLAKLVRQERFAVRRDTAFEEVIRACADRSSTWISEEIIKVYVALHRHGFAHSVECWQEGDLVGGLYGVALGGAFFGESMFYRVSNASKVALEHLVRHLRKSGFVLLDTQWVTPHLEQFGAMEIPRDEYERRLEHALRTQAEW